MNLLRNIDHNNPDELFIFAHRDNFSALLNDLVQNKALTLSEKEKSEIITGIQKADMAAYEKFKAIFSKKFPNYNLAELASNRQKRLDFYVTHKISSMLFDFQHEINAKTGFMANHNKNPETKTPSNPAPEQNTQEAKADNLQENSKKSAVESLAPTPLSSAQKQKSQKPSTPETKTQPTNPEDNAPIDTKILNESNSAPKQNPLDIEGAREYLSKKFLKENKSEWEEIKKLSVIHPALGGAIIAVDGAPTKDNVQNLQHLIGMNGNSPKNSADGILGKHTFKHIYDFIKNPTNNATIENKQEVDAIKKKMIFSENFKNTDPNKVWSQVLEKWNSLSDADKKNYSLISAVITENGATAENVENLQKFLKKELNFGDFAYQFDGMLGNVTSGQIIAFLNRKFPETQKPAPKTEETSASAPQATAQEAEVAVPTISASAVQENKAPAPQATAPVVEKLTPGV